MLLQDHKLQGSHHSSSKLQLFKPSLQAVAYPLLMPPCNIRKFQKEQISC